MGCEQAGGRAQWPGSVTAVPLSSCKPRRRTRARGRRGRPQCAPCCSASACCGALQKQHLQQAHASAVSSAPSHHVSPHPCSQSRGTRGTRPRCSPSQVSLIPSGGLPKPLLFLHRLPSVSSTEACSVIKYVRSFLLPQASLHVCLEGFDVGQLLDRLVAMCVQQLLQRSCSATFSDFFPCESLFRHNNTCTCGCIILRKNSIPWTPPQKFYSGTTHMAHTETHRHERTTQWPTEEKKSEPSGYRKFWWKKERGGHSDTWGTERWVLFRQCRKCGGLCVKFLEIVTVE